MKAINQLEKAIQSAIEENDLDTLTIKVEKYEKSQIIKVIDKTTMLTEDDVEAIQKAISPIYIKYVTRILTYFDVEPATTNYGVVYVAAFCIKVLNK